MLILTRAIRESIRIGDDVTVTVAGISGQQVKLGFQAPPEVIIMREELYKRDQANPSTPLGKSPKPR